MTKHVSEEAAYLLLKNRSVVTGHLLATHAASPQDHGRAALHNADVPILGAFGCGAFCNPPEVVAAAYRDVLPEFAYSFYTVEFAVYWSPRDDS